MVRVLNHRELNDKPAITLIEVRDGRQRQLTINLLRENLHKYPVGAEFPELFINRKFYAYDPPARVLGNGWGTLQHIKHVTHGELRVYPRTYLATSLKKDKYILSPQ
jgi:hypothetical protein